MIKTVLEREDIRKITSDTGANKFPNVRGLSPPLVYGVVCSQIINKSLRVAYVDDGAGWVEVELVGRAASEKECFVGR